MIEPRNLRVDGRRRRVHHSHCSQSIRIRGGGTGSAMFVTIPTFFRDNLKPMAKEIRESFQQRMDDLVEQKSIEREDQLNRNKIWRETAESPMQSAFSSSSYASSSQLESSSALKSSSYSQTRTSVKTVTLPTRMLKLSFAAFIVTETFGHIGVLEGETLEIIYARIAGFWENDVHRAFANVRSKVEGWYNQHVKRWISKTRAYYLEWREGNSFGICFHRKIRIKIPRICSTIKITFALSTICGMILMPWLFSSIRLLWRPVLVLVALSETNHHSKMRGRKFVELLGDTPQTLGVTLDVFLERFRKLIWNLIHNLKGSETESDYYYEGYGSGSTSRGAVDNSSRDSVSLGLMGGDVLRGDFKRKTKIRNRACGSDIYSLGISAYQYDLNDKKDFDMGVSSDKRRAITIQGLLWGCALGLALRGRWWYQTYCIRGRRCWGYDDTNINLVSKTYHYCAEGRIRCAIWREGPTRGKYLIQQFVLYLLLLLDIESLLGRYPPT